MDFDNHNDCLKGLKEAQDAQHDQREAAREARLFVTKRDGQWEPEWWQQNDNRPRYTFDMTSPIVDQIAGEIERANFAIEIDPKDGDASKDDAQVYEGIIRNIEESSEATEIYNAAARTMVESGLDHWRVVQRYADSDSFHQDLAIEGIPNSIDRCWLGTESQKQDGSDARRGWVMTAFTEAEFKKRWPEADAKAGALDDRVSNAYFNKPGYVICGEFYYIKEEERELVLMSSGKHYVADDNFKAILNDLAQKGVTEVSRRKSTVNRVYIRKFNEAGWLEKEEETVFTDWVPIIPLYGNFRIIEDKIVFHGAVEKVMDANRVMNYSLSREIEEGALAPRKKYWVTEKQIQGHEDEIATLNTNSDPVQIYNPDPDAPGVPMEQGGAQINPGLRIISDAMAQMMQNTQGMYSSTMGADVNQQSGVAIKRLQDKSDNVNVKYFKGMEIAIRQTARICVKAIPKLYTDERQLRLLNEDGSYEMVMLKDKELDQETGKVITFQDLSRGTFSVACSAGPAFASRRQETVEGIMEMAGVYPGLIDMGLDVLLKNVDAPGMDMLSERAREMLIKAGQIPFEQLTDEEKQELLQELQASQGNQQPDPAMLLGQAELMRAQTDQKKEERATLETMIKAQSESQKLILQQQKEDRETLLSLANTLKSLKDAMGADTIASPAAAMAYQKTAQTMNEIGTVYDFDPMTGRTVLSNLNGG